MTLMVCFLQGPSSTWACWSDARNPDDCHVVAGLVLENNMRFYHLKIDFSAKHCFVCGFKDLLVWLSLSTNGRMIPRIYTCRFLEP
jgi:hypothetical protein